jgi:hypothetical protein
VEIRRIILYRGVLDWMESMDEEASGLRNALSYKIEDDFLFVAQGDDWIHFCRAVRGNVARDERDGD